MRPLRPLLSKRKATRGGGLPDGVRRLRYLMTSGNGVLSVDGLDALVRGLAMTVVVMLSLVGYGRASGPGAEAGKVLDPLVVAAGLVTYNVLVIALLGVPWRHRPGFNLFILDWAVASLSIALTGWIFSPFIILLYALVIGVALRLGFSRQMAVVCACALLFLAVGALVETPVGPLKLPILVVESTSLVMVAVTAAALRRAVEVEIRHVELEEQSARQFRLLNELTNSLLSGTPDMDRITRSVAAVSSAALQAQAGLVVIPDMTGEVDGVDRASVGPGAPLGPGQVYLAPDSGATPIRLAPHERDLVAQVIAGGVASVVEEACGEGVVEFPALTRNGAAARTVLCVPLSLDGASLGALLVGRHSREAFTDTEVSLLSAIGQQLSVAIRLARIYGLEHEKAMASAERERLERDLLSIVSHDLRTPLTAIKICVGALSRDPIDRASQERMVRNIERNADRLAGLVDDLLDMARLRSGRVSLDLAPVNLGEALTELASQVWPMLESKNQALRVDLPARGSVRWNSLTLSADRKRIEQVVLNLLANAHKYAPVDSTITLGATPRNGEVRVFVRDEGPGIAQLERSKIFEKFYSSANSSTAEVSQSLGLGLAIARYLVSLHSGEIDVQSRVGGGSTFYFTLPRTPAAPAPLASAPSEVTSDAYSGN